MIKHWIVVAFAMLLGGVSPAMAGSVSAANTTICTSYGNIAVDPAGNVSITGCNLGSISASFTIVAAVSTVTTGTPLSVTVTRTIPNGGMAGNDTLTLTSNVAGTFTPATLTFAATDGASSSKPLSITFTVVGTATLSASMGTTVVASSSPITVTLGSTASCAGITPYPNKNNVTAPELLSSAGYAFGGVHFTDMVNGYAAGAIAFQVPADIPRSQYWDVLYGEYTGGPRLAVYSAISECSGDLRAILRVSFFRML